MLADRMLVTSLLVLSEMKQESPDAVRGSINGSRSSSLSVQVLAPFQLASFVRWKWTKTGTNVFSMYPSR